MNTMLGHGVTIGECAVTAIGKYFKKWVKQEDPVRADEDREALHQMRVGLRRLRSGLICFRPILSPQMGQQVAKLGKINRTLGAVRDLDVLRQELELNYLPLLPEEEQAKLRAYLDLMGKKRAKRFARLIKFLDSPFYQKTRNKIENWLKKPRLRESADFSIGEMLPTLLLPALKSLLLPNWDLTDPEELHDLRKQFKLVRYQLECFEDYFNEEIHQSLRHLRTSQDVLGFLHDRIVLLSFFSPKQWKELPRLKELIAQHQSEDWRTWYGLNYNLDWLRVLVQIRDWQHQG
jgi:CHAD domain-containing protein